MLLSTVLQRQNLSCSTGDGRHGISQRLTWEAIISARYTHRSMIQATIAAKYPMLCGADRIERSKIFLRRFSVSHYLVMVRNDCSFPGAGSWSVAYIPPFSNVALVLLNMIILEPLCCRKPKN